MNVRVRDSHYELIRIIAMVLIVIHHIFVHCINAQISDPSICKTAALFNDYIVHKRLVIIDFANSFGKIGNILFMMISGFFLVEKNIVITKHIRKLLTQMFFVAIVLVVVSYIHLHFERITAAQTIHVFNDGWWFAGYYISTIVIAWLGLNRYIQKVNKEKYQAILIVLFSIISIGWIRSTIGKIGLDQIISGVFLYLLGGYIHLYDPFQRIKKRYMLFIIAFSFAIMSVSYYLYAINSINQAIEKHETYKQVIHGYGEYSVLCLLVGVMLFEIIRKLNIHNSRIINYTASATFIIYLVHDNDYMRELFYKIKWVELLYRRDYFQFVLSLVVVVLCVFIIGVLLNTLFEQIKKIYLSLCRS